MIVFKNYFKLAKANIFSILLYVIIFIGFASFAAGTGGSNTEFVPVRPNVAVINNSDNKIASSFVNYISDKANIKEFTIDEVDDALFYREIEYVFYIDSDFSLDSKIKTKKIPGSTSAMYIEMLFNRYLNVLSTYQENGISMDKAIELAQLDLDHESEVSIVVDDASGLMMAGYYFNFSNYSIVAISIFMISTIIMAFRKEAVNKRNRVSSMSYKRINRQLFVATSVLSFMLFIFVSLMSIFFFGSTLISIRGLFLFINLFVFIFTIQGFSLLISQFIKNKDALTGVINITALGSSFISGAFVPQFILGSFVVGLSMIFPSYYFISNNNLLVELSNFSLENLYIYFINIAIMILFSIAFYILNNYFSKKRQ